MNRPNSNAPAALRKLFLSRSPWAIAAVEGQPEGQRMVAMLEGKTGFAAGLLGALLIALATCIDRLLLLPSLYEQVSDLLIHAALEFGAGAIVWLAIWSVLSGITRVVRQVPNRFQRRFLVLGLVVGGLVLGLSAYFFVVRPSARSILLPQSGWIAALSFAGVVFWGVVYGLLRLRVPLRAAALGVVLLAATITLHLAALRHYHRHYGNLHSYLLAGISCVAALGCALVGIARRSRARANLGRVLAALLLVSIGVVSIIQPSFSVRRAVFAWGGTAKRAFLHVLWPLVDGDRDGSPSCCWGTDPDDTDPRKNAVMSAGPNAAVASVVNLGARGDRRRNLLWIVVDTVRRDTFERILAEEPELSRRFEPFTYFRRYTSCSSRTNQVMSKLLGGHCESAQVTDYNKTSAVEILQQAGYKDHLIGYFPLQLPFRRVDQRMDDDWLLSRARAALSEQSSEPRALFLHIKGAHHPYSAPGKSEHEQYVRSVSASLHAVSDLFPLVSPEAWTVVVLGDHGEEFGEHGTQYHATSLYEEVLRTPVLIRDPGSPPGTSDEAFSCSTLSWRVLRNLGIVDQEPPTPSFQYASLNVGRGEFGYSLNTSIHSLKEGRLKAIWTPEIGVFELYDLDADPSEQKSLATRHPELLAPLQRRLESLARDCP